MIPFSILWAGFAFTWEATVITSGIWSFALFGVPFVLIGAYMLVGRFGVDALARSRTVYAVTTKRALIETGVLRAVTTSWRVDHLPPITVSRRRNGSGSITFGEPRPMFFQMMQNPYGQVGGSPRAFDDLANVDAANDALERAQREAKRR